MVISLMVYVQKTANSHADLQNRFLKRHQICNIQKQKNLVTFVKPDTSNPSIRKTDWINYHVNFKNVFPLSTLGN